MPNTCLTLNIYTKAKLHAVYSISYRIVMSFTLQTCSLVILFFSLLLILSIRLLSWQNWTEYSLTAYSFYWGWSHEFATNIKFKFLLNSMNWPWFFFFFGPWIKISNWPRIPVIFILANSWFKSSEFWVVKSQLYFRGLIQDVWELDPAIKSYQKRFSSKTNTD